MERLAGTVQLMGDGRNDARDAAGYTDGYATAATPLISARLLGPVCCRCSMPGMTSRFAAA
jgi:hypothetical protein